MKALFLVAITAVSFSASAKSINYIKLLDSILTSNAYSQCVETCRVNTDWVTCSRNCRHLIKGGPRGSTSR